MSLAKRFGRGVTLAALVVASSGCSSLSFLNPFGPSAPKVAPLVNFQPTLTVRTEWTASAGSAGAYVFQPAIVGSAVFAAGQDGTVARFEDGRAVWKVNAERKLTTGVGANARLALVASEKGEVIALDAGTGSVKWVHKINAEVLAPPAVGDALVVVRTSDNRLVALDPSDGQRKWTYQRSNPPLALRNFTGVSFEGGVVLAGFPGGKLVAVNPVNGGAIFELTVAVPKGSTELERVADVIGPPVVQRQEVCAVAYQGRIGCFDGTNGNTLWSREFSSPVGLDRDTRNVYVTDDQDAVSALDASTGASLWKQDRLAKRGVSRPVTMGGYVVVGDREGYVHWLQKDDGAFAARVRPDSSGVAALRVLGSGVVVQTRAGGVYFLAPQ
ncbi:MAG: outer membrane protein assembly factor BamB [Zoogloeaceae bacterium]|nr:outer membrane protein assembly factor BamB [Zoogloeaceae bacterium]